VVFSAKENAVPDAPPELPVEITVVLVPPSKVLVAPATYISSHTR
jgi:hypothetical protein